MSWVALLWEELIKTCAAEGCTECAKLLEDWSQGECGDFWQETDDIWEATPFDQPRDQESATDAGDEGNRFDQEEK